MNSKGSHVVCELTGCCPDTIADARLIEAILRDGAIAAQATVVHGFFHEFRPAGVTGMLCLAESHMSVHTWPETGYVALDIYTCGEHTAPRAAVAEITARLKARASYIVVLTRGEHEREGRFASTIGERGFCPLMSEAREWGAREGDARERTDSRELCDSRE